MEIELSPSQRRELRARAHHLRPVVMIGDAGPTEAVMAEIERNLSSHGLIKVRAASNEHATRTEWLNTICSTLGAAPVQHIGKILTVYRPLPDKPAAAPGRKPRPARKGPRRTKRSFQH
jgi:RNA-binding protein